MRRLVAILASLAVFALPACQNDSEPTQPESPVTVTDRPSEIPSKAPLTDEEYADLVRSQSPRLAELSTEQLIQNAEVVCSALDEGLSVEKIAGIMRDNGFTARESGVLIGGAIAHSCRHHQNLIDNGSPV